MFIADKANILGNAASESKSSPALLPMKSNHVHDSEFRPLLLSHVLRAIKLLHVSLCETAACGWKLTPDSWSVSQQSRTSDPHTFINTVCVYDDLKCQVRPSQTAACLLSDPLVALATPPSQAPSFLYFPFQSRPKIGYLTDYSPLCFQSLPRHTGKLVQEREKSVRSAGMSLLES